MKWNEVKEDIAVKVTAIVGIVILDSWAIYNNIDGVMLATSLAIIGGIAGFQFKGFLDKINK